MTSSDQLESTDGAEMIADDAMKGGPKEFKPAWQRAWRQRQERSFDRGRFGFYTSYHAGFVCR